LAEPPGVVRFHEGVVRVRDQASLRELLSSHELDFGCAPHVTEERDGAFLVPVIGTNERLAALRAEGFEIEIHDLPEPQRDVGAGDRFKDGRTYPTGYGVKLFVRSTPTRGDTAALSRDIGDRVTAFMRFANGAIGRFLMLAVKRGVTISPYWSSSS
jgi:hypothetical protein